MHQKCKQAMNCVTAHEQHVLELVDIIDFKWLMAHEGHHVHVERLQSDRDYASQCLHQADQSTVGALRQAAKRLARSLSL
jgi:hypothetical protein